ncbi:16871_t:CDS:2 [Cetraspora pellucida]|uniref:16871_t:CDS:1 n=1 Tax=Cetraspora pellucida TaxID=1433469 RepID=A0A9N9EYR5_9GLOM|nr:16871_t:CDS:2 [Cetraspora pellucida]
MATKTASPKTQKPKVNNFVLVLEQFLEKHNLTADSISEQLNKHAPKLDQIEALLPDKRKGKLTIEERAKYCAKISDAMDIFTYHLDLDPKNDYENKIVANVSKIPSKEDLADVIVMLSMRPAKVRSPQIFHYESDPLNAPVWYKEEKSLKCIRELLTWIQNAIKTKKLHDPVFTENETYYGSKHASRIHDNKKPTPQHLKLLSKIAMRQESDHLDAGDNYAIGNTESEESDSEPKTTEIDAMLAEIQK